MLVKISYRSSSSLWWYLSDQVLVHSRTDTVLIGTLEFSSIIVAIMMQCTFIASEPSLRLKSGAILEESISWLHLLELLIEDILLVLIAAIVRMYLIHSLNSLHRKITFAKAHQCE